MTNNPGLLVISMNRFLIFKPEVDVVSNCESKYCDSILVTRITRERINEESKSETKVPVLKLRSRKLSLQRNLRSNSVIIIVSGQITAK